MKADLDLNYRAWTKTKHGVTAIGTWVRTENTTFRPCMVLIRAGSEFEDHTVPYVITVDAAWQWEPDTADFQQTLMIASKICECLRFTVDRYNISRIFNFVNDHLSDLISIPPYPGEEKTVVADLIIHDNRTGRTIEREMTDV